MTTEVLDQNPGKDRIAYAVLVGALLVLAGYVGGRYLHRTAPIVFSDAPPPAAPAPTIRPAPAVDEGEKSAVDTGQTVEVEPAATHPKPAGRPKSDRKPLPAPSSISLNGSDGKALQALPGVGPATAKRIIEYRRLHGRFSSVDELLAVKGIGPKKLAKMRPYVRL